MMIFIFEESSHHSICSLQAEGHYWIFIKVS